jgi:hypothetical protein
MQAVPDVLHPFKYVLHSSSVVKAPSEHYLALHTAVEAVATH